MDQSAYSVRLSKKGLDYQEVMHDFGVILVNIVDSNKTKYSVIQYSNAETAHALQEFIGRPSTEDFFK